MSNQRPSFAKRDREMRLKDKARAKAERRAAKKAAKLAEKTAPAGDDVAPGSDGTTTDPSVPATPAPTETPQ